MIIALSWEDIDEVNAFVKQHELTLPVLLGTPDIAQAYQISAFPTYYILDQQGLVIDRSVGYSSEFGLRWRT